ncbi:MAG: hypothetical protein Q6A81_17010 [Enterococcus casseliflavus]|nr:hypothetical protein [Enterococcus casseliflavus]
MKGTKQLKRLGLSLVIILGLVSGFQKKSFAQEVSAVETEGTVRFTGVWVDPNQPNPAPPEGEKPEYGAKPPTGGNRPGSNLPQTNTIKQRGWTFIGLLLIFNVLYRWYKNNKLLFKEEGTNL